MEYVFISSISTIALSPQLLALPPRSHSMTDTERKFQSSVLNLGSSQVTGKAIAHAHLADRMGHWPREAAAFRGKRLEKALSERVSS